MAATERRRSAAPREGKASRLSPPKERTGAKKAYHHGDLRRAVLDGALKLIAQQGLDSLSLREVAAAAGVSHTAPYHHFEDKTALVRALAEEGVMLMDEMMAAREEAAGKDPAERLLAVGMAYVRFAVERPDYYETFTAPELAVATRIKPASAPRSTEEGGPTWVRLLSAITHCQRSGDLPAGDPVIVAVQLWSLVHGLVGLWRHGPLRYLPQSAGGLEPFADQVLRAALGSMRAPRGRATRSGRTSGPARRSTRKES